MTEYIVVGLIMGIVVYLWYSQTLAESYDDSNEPLWQSIRHGISLFFGIVAGLGWPFVFAVIGIGVVFLGIGWCLAKLESILSRKRA